jgi:uncharacterized protein (DUF2235 family)
MKRIVICADGTWNLRDQEDRETGKRRPTNVTKVARAVVPRTAAGIDQVVYYHDGLGTSGPLDKVTGGAFGDGIEDNVRNLYRFIVYNYLPGDEIYLFGFSRGAFTVRTLAGFMHRMGLVEKDDDYFVPDLYACYEKRCAEDSEQWKFAHRHIRNKRPCPPIHMIGVWDTVGSLGAPGALGQVLNRNKYDYHDVTLHDSVANAYHALAIDELRKPFAPTLWQRPATWRGKLEQAWFPGVHTGIGGGYSPDGLANCALHWIVEKAEDLGLEVDRAYLGFFRPCFNSEKHESFSFKYQVLGGKHHRPIGEFAAHGECVHESAIDRRNLLADYRPPMLEKYLAGGAVAPYARTRRFTPGVAC